MAGIFIALALSINAISHKELSLSFLSKNSEGFKIKIKYNEEYIMIS